MKKTLCLLVLMCVLLSLFCGCTVDVPKFLPGEQEGDENCVWVCTEPFAFFSLTDDHDGGDYGHMKGYIEREDGLTCFYTSFTRIGGVTFFRRPEIWNDPSSNDDFWGYANYHKDYFYFTTERDDINFFGGELPRLEFDRMTKEEFAEKYENLSDFVNSK